MICALLEREFCFLVEAYNLIVGGEVTLGEDLEACRTVVLCGSMKVKVYQVILKDMTNPIYYYVDAPSKRIAKWCGANLFNNEYSSWNIYMKFPVELNNKLTKFSSVTDSNNVIWIMTESGQVWRGGINRLMK